MACCASFLQAETPTRLPAGESHIRANQGSNDSVPRSEAMLTLDMSDITQADMKGNA